MKLFRPLALVILLATAAGASAQDLTYTTYEIPDGKTSGPLVLVLKSGEGLKLPESTKPVTYTFPDDGKLVVDKESYEQNRAGFNEGNLPPGYAGPRAKYVSGAHLPIEGLVEDSEPAFRTAYTAKAGEETGETAEGAIYYYIGTQAETEAFAKKNREEKAAK